MKMIIKDYNECTIKVFESSVVPVIGWTLKFDYSLWVVSEVVLDIGCVSEDHILILICREVNNG